MNLTLVFGMGNGRYPTVSVTEKWALGKAEGWKSLFSPGDPRSKELGWQLSKEHEILQGKKFNTFLNWPEGDSRRSYITNSERFWLFAHFGGETSSSCLQVSCPGGQSCLLSMGALIKKQDGQKTDLPKFSMLGFTVSRDAAPQNLKK